MNFYETLEVSSTASQEDIKKSYRSLALKFHPDRNPNNPEAEKRFKEINNAYEVLSNPEKRSEYDQSLQHPSSRKPFLTPEDIFSDLFSNFGRIHNPFNQHTTRRHTATLNLTLAETLEAKEHLIRFSVKKPCSSCKGTAVSPHAERCSTCKGSGEISGRMCMGCGGHGSIYNRCKSCNGAGGQEEEKEARINLPRGLINNCQFQTTTSFGIVLVAITVTYPEGTRLGADGRLIKEVFIPYPTAVLGGVHPVETIEGDSIKVRFPPLQNGQLIKIKGKGLYPGPDHPERGDLFLKPFVAIPKVEELSEEHKTMIEKLATLYSTPQE